MKCDNCGKAAEIGVRELTVLVYQHKTGAIICAGHVTQLCKVNGRQFPPKLPRT